MVPGFQNDPRDMSLELHPGVVMGVSDGLAAGLRLAVDVRGNAWGFTPLLNRRIYDASTHSLFGELVVPPLRRWDRWNPVRRWASACM